MESVCEVVGFEHIISEESGEVAGSRISAQRPLSSEVIGEGIESVRIYINTKYVKYEPQLGDKIGAITNDRGYVERIIKF